METLQTEAILLLREAPRLSRNALLSRLNEAVADVALRFSAPSDAEGGGEILFSSPDLHLRLALCERPLPAERLVESGAEGTVASDLSPALRRSLRRHGATLTLRVDDGSRPGVLPLHPMAPEFVLLVLVRATAALGTCHAPEAILWGPSRRLLLPDTVCAASRAGFPAHLAYRAVEIEPGRPDGMPGMRAIHSELYCGRQLVIPPGLMPPAEARAAISRAIELHVSRAAILSDGAAIAVSDRLQLRISPCTERRFCPTGGFRLMPEPLGTPAPAHGHAARPCPVRRAAHGPSRPPRRPRRLARARIGFRRRSDALRSYALCAALATISPVSAAGLFLWNLLRGPNLAASAVATAAVLAGFVGLAAMHLTTGSRVAAQVLDALGPLF